jgi:hypothetical protein
MTDTEAAFRRSVQALAQDPGVQAGLHPESESLGDELVRTFDAAWRRYKGTRYNAMSPRQRGSVRELATYLESMSGEHNPEFWSDREALGRDARWADIRQKARAVLEAFGWPIELPS